MITSNEELSSSLRYATRWADMLEGMRRDAQEHDAAALLPSLAAGPLNELRRALADMRDYIDAQIDDAAESNGAGFVSVRNPAHVDESPTAKAPFLARR